jgi:hypothetical protein
MSGVYLQQARVLAAAGRTSAAVRLLSTSLELAPGSSEALFLQAFLLLPDMTRTREVEALLQRALTAGTWTETDPDEARLALARITLRTGRPVQALHMAAALVLRRPEDPRVSLLHARCLEAAGRAAEARAAAVSGIPSFPKEQGFPLLASRLAQRAGDLAGARAFISAGLHVMPESLPLLLRSVELEPEAARKAAGTDVYDSRGGADPLAAAVALESGPRQPARYLDMFLARGGLSRADLTRRVAVAASASPELSATLRKALSAFTGTAILDQDPEGFPAETWEYHEGEPTRWTRDADRDGVPELTAVLAAGLPRALTAFEKTTGGGGAASWMYTYDTYPFIASVQETTARGARAWSLTPRALGCMLLEGAGPVDPLQPRASTAFSVPSEKEVLRAAYAVEDRTAGGTLLARVDMKDGEPQHMEEDSDGDGRIDHRVWYLGGRPVRGDRDLEGSGVFSVTEEYRGGRLWMTAADLDRDGTPDYAEQHDGVRLVKLWNYDGAGGYDARETSGAGDTVVREVSTALDGRFNLRITWKGGAIQGVEKDGRKAAVTRDPAAGVTWIGAPARAVSAAALKEGLFTAAGRMYIAFRFGGVMYVEEMK